jgi:endonuclease I
MGIIIGEKRECDKCDVEIKNKKVEPKESIRGEITRTYLGPLFLCTKKVIQGSTS